jgi:cell surface protein SprA
LTATRQFSRNNSEFFRYNGSRFESQGVTETGNFSVSVIAWNTAFVKDDKTTYASATFDKFNQNRLILSERLASENPNSNGFAAPDTLVSSTMMVMVVHNRKYWRWHSYRLTQGNHQPAST